MSQLDELPSRRDPFAARAVSGVVGGVWGRYAAVSPSSFWTPVRVLMAITCLTLLLGYAQKSPCASGSWVGWKQYTHGCYSDVVPLWSAERLDVGAVPYRDTAVEYPVLTGGFMWLSAGLTSAFTAVTQHFSDVFVFDTISSLLLAICALFITYATARTAGRRPYDAAIFAASPLLIFHAFTNWDLFAMALTAGAMWAWTREKPVAAGVLIGLGTAAKLYPVFILVALLIIAYRTRGEPGKGWAPTRWAIFAAAASWCAVNVPIALAYHQGWWEFYKFSADRPVERSSLWAVGHTLFTGGLDVADAPYWVPASIAVALLLGAALLFVVWAALRAPVTPTLGQLAFLCVLAFLLTTKVWSPQYSLWLVPLIALARPKWRLQLIWQFSEIAVWLITLQLLLHLDGANSAHGPDYGWLALSLVARDALLIAIAVLVVRDMWAKPAGWAGGFDTATESPTQPPELVDDFGEPAPAG